MSPNNMNLNDMSPDNMSLNDASPENIIINDMSSDNMSPNDMNPDNMSSDVLHLLHSNIVHNIISKFWISIYYSLYMYILFFH